VGKEDNVWRFLHDKCLERNAVLGTFDQLVFCVIRERQECQAILGQTKELKAASLFTFSKVRLVCKCKNGTVRVLNSATGANNANVNGVAVA
jgi:hypothetical protein